MQDNNLAFRQLQNQNYTIQRDKLEQKALRKL
jgi:hypothetical protein